jgi:uncharacterized membrane protein
LYLFIFVGFANIVITSRDEHPRYSEQEIEKAKTLLAEVKMEFLEMPDIYSLYCCFNNFFFKHYRR